jgi:RES domain-containing protein
MAAGERINLIENEVVRRLAVSSIAWLGFFDAWLLAVGDQWIAEGRSVALLVPSVVVPVERNALINPRHPRFKLGWVEKPERFRYDPRLGSGGA